MRQPCSLREIFNAIFHMLKTGCQRRMLSNDFPKRQSVYSCFSKWKMDGTIEEIHEIIRELTHKNARREHSPGLLGLIDSQSVKTTRSGGLCRGADGRKITKGRKRHIIVDATSLVLGCGTCRQPARQQGRPICP
jgi:transposase